MTAATILIRYVFEKRAKLHHFSCVNRYNYMLNEDFRNLSSRSALSFLGPHELISSTIKAMRNEHRLCV